RIQRRTRGDGFAVEANFTARAFIHAEETVHQFGTSRADQTRKTQYFAAVHAERNISHFFLVPAGDVVHLKHRVAFDVAGALFHGVKAVLQFAADHQAHNVVV